MKPRQIHDRLKWIPNPSPADVCCICFFNWADVKRSKNKYHHTCYQAHLKSHSPPPEDLVPHNRSKE